MSMKIKTIKMTKNDHIIDNDLDFSTAIAALKMSPEDCYLNAMVTDGNNIIIFVDDAHRICERIYSNDKPAYNRVMYFRFELLELKYEIWTTTILNQELTTNKLRSKKEYEYIYFDGSYECYLKLVKRYNLDAKIYEPYNIVYKEASKAIVTKWFETDNEVWHNANSYIVMELGPFSDWQIIVSYPTIEQLLNSYEEIK